MNIKPSVSKRTIRMATALALLAAMSVIAASLLMSSAGGATAFNVGGSDGVAGHMPIPAQYSAQCSNGVAVPNPESNTGLVADCAALLASKDALEGTDGNLDWSADVGISDWDGVTIAGNRVSRLDLGREWGTHPSDKLTGKIPAELGNLANLEWLRLTNNQLTGEIPAELGNLANLQQLVLTSNQLTGEIPAELGNLANLQHLLLHENQLTGEIPVELGSLANLGWLFLSSNQLSGEIPVELGNLSNLMDLELNDNQLSGEIPAEFGNLSNLKWLYLYRNRLNGKIPVELGNLANLRQLLLSSNQLTGKIPSELGNLSELIYLYLSNNRLTGEIPVELGNLSNLQHLHLQENQLSGEIPAELGNLSNLGWLTLHSNQLTGCIPQSLRVHLGVQDIQRIGLPLCGETTSATPTATSTPGGRATPIATPTPTATSAPRPSAAPVATPTPTATSAASNDVMNRLAALERQVAEIPDLKNQIAALATIVAQLEGGTGQGAATATPTPTATPASAIEASPTPTATPSPTPTSVAGTSGDDACVERLAGNGSVNGRWTPDCLTANSPDNRTYYARFYTFTLYAASEVTITLSSADATPYLFLLEGEGTGGDVKQENGVANANSVTITAALQPGAYTIEASTYRSETTGDFTLEMEVTR